MRLEARSFKPSTCLERFNSIPDHCHLQKEYQDWLCSIGLLKRVSLINKGVKIEKGDMMSGKEMVRFLMMQRVGYFVSKELLYYSLCGDLRWNKYPETALGDISSAAVTVLNNPSLQVRGVGYGAGIETFKLTYKQMRILHGLWADMNQSVPSTDLNALVDLGKTDTRARMHHMRGQIRNLRRQLEGSGVRIDTTYVHTGIYTYDNPRPTSYQLTT